MPCYRPLSSSHAPRRDDLIYKNATTVFPQCYIVDVPRVNKMTHNPSDSRHKKREHSPPSPHPSPKLSPAEAISEAWKRESAETRERWRKMQEEAERQYTHPKRRIHRTKL